MNKISYRLLRIAGVIQQELAVVLQREVAEPAFGMITISMVKVSPDLSYAKVFLTFFNTTTDIPQLLKLLNERAGYFRSLLSKKVHARRIPALHFVFDENLLYANHLTQLINNASHSDANDESLPPQKKA